MIHYLNNQIIWLSKDHNVLHDILNKGYGHREMFMNPKTLNRFFGKGSDVLSEYFSFNIEEGDQVLLCSDGLSNFLPETEIIHAITQHSRTSYM